MKQRGLVMPIHEIALELLLSVQESEYLQEILVT